MGDVRYNVLVVEDDRALGELLLEELEAEGYRVRHVETAEAAMECIDEVDPDLVVTDLQLPGADGLALLEAVRERHVAPATLMISAYGTVDRAVAALKAGADNFLTKPLDMDHFILSVERVLANRRLRSEVRRFREMLERDSFHGMEGSSRAMRVLFDRVAQVARADGAVLVSGESGTGKDLIAHAIHAESPRADMPFLAVNCAGVPADLLESEFFGHAEGAFSGADRARPGLFREADGGTLFLDEIGEMPTALQAKLLRALQDGRIRPVGADREHQVDVRLIAATNQDLQSLVEKGEFREDLYYRLEAFQLSIPPLRERGEDLELLAMSFLARFAAASRRPARRLSEQALRAVREYHWPGNVRELKNAMERAVTFCEDEEVGIEHLPERVRQGNGKPASEDSSASTAVPDALLKGDMLPSLDELRSRYVHYVLERVDGNKRRAAALLGVGRRTLYRWLEQ
ncbi:sigma-54-dependent Fis family transcriptional regulator [Wenzhouxiangella sp. AB-CW3]|uniref:sigma-54-dependent transcriptional regulator n=1 Tax=Wenzhouxiangella sp. AB-CW3 TaxID=2771012 RepID=UPI00168AC724|nr:sigma-54 dependent transcriptional regulator [Wenzhouxiangella sp. AB-CW3]QOC23969.1 sigma-54-dependent Fis family transcriptional regulator [Wenzhouxiangella sp. AB-CW3]